MSSTACPTDKNFQNWNKKIFNFGSKIAEQNARGSTAQSDLPISPFAHWRKCQPKISNICCQLDRISGWQNGVLANLHWKQHFNAYWPHDNWPNLVSCCVYNKIKIQTAHAWHHSIHVWPLANLVVHLNLLKRSMAEHAIILSRIQMFLVLHVENVSLSWSIIITRIATQLWTI